MAACSQVETVVMLSVVQFKCVQRVCVEAEQPEGWAVPLGVYVNSNPSVPLLVILELGGVCTPGARNLGWRGNLRILPPTM